MDQSFKIIKRDRQDIVNPCLCSQKPKAKTSFWNKWNWGGYASFHTQLSAVNFARFFPTKAKACS
jgi:hypothetical protein